MAGARGDSKTRLHGRKSDVVVQGGDGNNIRRKPN